MVLTVTRATFQPERSELKAFALRNMLLFVPPTVALPGPDLPYAGSTEPFDGIERSHLTEHLEFKCFESSSCFQKVTVSIENHLVLPTYSK